jgi:hypothetical protein
MKPEYSDIRKRINKEPLWYDAHGVPRYEKFSPKLTSDIYSQEVLLIEILCQDCGKGFYVEINWGGASFLLHPESYRDRIMKHKKELKRRREKKTVWHQIHYGDPPRHGGCTGETMNCIDRRILRFYRRSRETRWRMTRRRSLEIWL